MNFFERVQESDRVYIFPEFTIAISVTSLTIVSVTIITSCMHRYITLCLSTLKYTPAFSLTKGKKEANSVQPINLMKLELMRIGNRISCLMKIQCCIIQR